MRTQNVTAPYSLKNVNEDPKYHYTKYVGRCGKGEHPPAQKCKQRKWGLKISVHPIRWKMWKRGTPPFLKMMTHRMRRKIWTRPKNVNKEISTNLQSRPRWPRFGAYGKWNELHQSTRLRRRRRRQPNHTALIHVCSLLGSKSILENKMNHTSLTVL